MVDMFHVEVIDIRFMLIIVVIAILGSLMALDYSTKSILTKKKHNLSSLLIISFGMGFGLWCISMIGIMGSYSPEGFTNFHEVLYVISFLFSSIGSLFGFYIISIKEKSILQHLISGCLFAVAIVTAQYMGVFALHEQGDLAFSWGHIFLSFIFALLTAFSFLYFLHIPINHKEHKGKRLLKKSGKSIIMGGSLALMQVFVLNGAYYSTEASPWMSQRETIDMMIVAIYLGIAATFIFISFIIAIYVANERALYDKSISDEKFKSLFHYNPLIVLELSKTGIIKDVNQSFLVNLGYTKEQVVNEKIYWLFSVEHKEVIQQCMENALLKEAKVTQEMTIVKKDGDLLPVKMVFLPIQQYAHTIGIYLIASDLSERNKALFKQHSAEEELRDILKNQLCIITVFKKKNNRFVHTLIDGKLLYRAGLNPDQFTGRYLEDIPLTEEEYGYHLKHYEKAWNGSEVTYESCFRDRTILSSLMPVKKGGKTIEVVSTIVDITKQKIAEREMVAAKELADKANDAKSQFLSKMSHELRTPLNGVLGFTQVLELDEGLTEVQASHVKEIYTAGRHLLKLIDSVLDLARIESGNLKFSIKEVSLNKILQQSIRMVEPDAANNGIKLVNKVPEDDFKVKADSTKLRQVFINLLDNAIKYNRVNGEVIIETLLINERVCVDIIDTGIGIHDEELEHVVKPFYRSPSTKSTISGAGIGLSLVKQIIDTLDGTFHIESEVGKGSVVRIELPLIIYAAGDDSVEQAVSYVPDSLRISPSTILYIEDNRMNQQLLESLLRREKEKLNLLIVPNGVEGIKTLRTQQIDLVLLDMDLPDISGLDVLDILRIQEKSEIPIIGVSANAMKADIDMALSRGLNDYITKPIDVKKLYKVLKQHLEGEK
ncbi:ATP-binding protein [Bacillus sp. AK031]